MTKATHMMVKAIKPFEWKGDIKHPKRSKAFLVERRKGEELKANRLVTEVPDEVPQEPVGTPSSASPAGQASQNETANTSDNGGPDQNPEGGEQAPEAKTEDGEAKPDEQAKPAEEEKPAEEAPTPEISQPTQGRRSQGRGRNRGA